uniref:U4/U6.U5 small nuclear ribonucleoprotein 27 kDa protein n=1 Tax=Syphacia muris TaxID=451379 RepID=A0A0N5AVV7_9BILA
MVHERSHSKERDRDKRRRSRSRSVGRSRIADKDRSRRRSQERYRSRSPIDRKRSRSRSRDRRDRLRRKDSDDQSRRYSFVLCLIVLSFGLNQIFNIIAEVIDLDSLKGIDKEFAKVMGFTGFNTTKNKKVPGNHEGAVKINKPRRYRQYMNRKGGFNRPLDYVA